MISLPSSVERLPQGLVREEERFVPRIVMTPQLQCVVSDVLNQWRHRDKFKGMEKYGIRPLDRLLFYGPPGNGKTMACYWIARELKVPMFRVVCNNLIGSCLGETTKAVSAVTEWLNTQREPAVCLWDEVEAIFIDRTRSNGQCDREIGTALTMFLQQLDRWKAPTLNVMATNLIEHLDAALISRIEMRIEFVGPTAEQSSAMLEYWAELLHDHGGPEWKTDIAESIAKLSERFIPKPVQIVTAQQPASLPTQEEPLRNFDNLSEPISSVTEHTTHIIDGTPPVGRATTNE